MNLKNKKLLIFLVFIIGLAMTLFYFFQKELDQTSDQDFSIDKLPAQKLIKVAETSQELKEEESDEPEKDFTALDDALEVIEERWDRKVEDLFLKDLKLTKQDFEDYLVMRRGLELDLADVHDAFREKVLSEQGEDYEYAPTGEVLDEQDKVIEEYHNLFRNRFGDEAFTQFHNALVDYNKELRLHSNPEFGILTIDF